MEPCSKKVTLAPKTNSNLTFVVLNLFVNLHRSIHLNQKLPGAKCVLGGTTKNDSDDNIIAL